MSKYQHKEIWEEVQKIGRAKGWDTHVMERAYYSVILEAMVTLALEGKPKPEQQELL